MKNKEKLEFLLPNGYFEDDMLGLEARLLQGGGVFFDVNFGRIAVKFGKLRGKIERVVVADAVSDRLDRFFAGVHQDQCSLHPRVGQMIGKGEVGLAL